MALNPGTKLGPYQIQSSLGAGGMGEVEPFWRRERAAQRGPQHAWFSRDGVRERRTGVARRNPEWSGVPGGPGVGLAGWRSGVRSGSGVGLTG